MSEVDDLKTKLQSKLGQANPPAIAKGSSLIPVNTVVKDAELKAPDSFLPPALLRFFQALGALFTPDPNTAKHNPSAAAIDSSLFKVLVAQLESDIDGAAQAHLLQSFGQHPALKLQSLAKSFSFANPDNPAAAAALQTNLRHTVAAEGGHLLIWGGLNPEGYRLCFSTAQAEERNFGLNTRLELPLDFSEPAMQVLYAATLASVEAMTETQKKWIRQSLPAAAALAEELSSRPSVQMSMAQQRSIQVVFGHIALAAADCVAASEAPQWTDRAITSYRSAQKRVNRNDPLWEQGLIHRHLGAALTAQAEKSPTPIPLFKEAVEEWRQAAETLTRATMPQEWAQSQIKLGNALYKLDLVTGDSELLREALNSLQGALQVYSRTETPQKWADTMHDMAQVLQIYGDQLKNPDVLKKSIETCDAILHVYSKERTPLSWAKTQNTLGSALFLFDRHKGGNEHLDEAQTALEGALEVFKTHNAKGPATVAERNLAHVHRLKNQRKNHKLADPDWTQERS